MTGVERYFYLELSIHDVQVLLIEKKMKKKKIESYDFNTVYCKLIKGKSC